MPLFHRQTPRLTSAIFYSMASLRLLLSLIIIINHLSAHAQTGFLLPITKHLQTHQYTTQLLIGTPPLPTNLLLHLSGPSLCLDCSQFNSSTRQLMRRASLPKYSTQHLIPDLAQDTVTIVDSLGSVATLDRFLFSCSNGLPTGAKGLLGLTGFQSQVVNSFDIPRKFTVCLSSSEGFIISGTGTGISKSLSYTPLIWSQGYYVKVNWIKINGRKVVLEEMMRNGLQVEISTIVPYTKMKSRMYGVFTKAYVKAASAMKMTRVDPVAPFGICFRRQGELAAPEIELVFQSALVKWRIQGMVQVSDSVMCLGVVDGGMDMNCSVVLGGYQLEDHILEFNLGTGMMGFSPDRLEGMTCSHLRPSVSRPPQSTPLG